MPATVKWFECRSRKQAMTLPHVTAFPASFLIEEGCGGSFAAGRGQGCPTTVSYGSLANTWSQSGSNSGTDGGVPWSVSWSASVSSIGDQGNGYWRYQVNLSKTSSGATVTGLKMRFDATGADYVNGDYIDVAYLTTIDITAGSGYIQFNVSGGGGGPGLIQPSLSGNFTPYGFYWWAVYYDFATMVLGGNDRFEVTDDCTLSTYCDAPTPTTGAFTARRIEWRAKVSGATPKTYLDVYFHIESRVIGVGSWTETTQIDGGGVADENGDYLSPWVFVTLGATYEYRLKVGNEVDFTDFFGGPPPGP